MLKRERFENTWTCLLYQTNVALELVKEFEYFLSLNSILTIKVFCTPKWVTHTYISTGVHNLVSVIVIKLCNAPDTYANTMKTHELLCLRHYQIQSTHLTSTVFIRLLFIKWPKRSGKFLKKEASALGVKVMDHLTIRRQAHAIKW